MSHHGSGEGNGTGTEGHPDWPGTSNFRQRYNYQKSIVLINISVTTTLFESYTLGELKLDKLQTAIDQYMPRVDRCTVPMGRSVLPVYSSIMGVGGVL